MPIAAKGAERVRRVGECVEMFIQTKSPRHLASISTAESALVGRRVGTAPGHLSRRCSAGAFIASARRRGIGRSRVARGESDASRKSRICNLTFRLVCGRRRDAVRGGARPRRLPPPPPWERPWTRAVWRTPRWLRHRPLPRRRRPRLRCPRPHRRWRHRRRRSLR